MIPWDTNEGALFHHTNSPFTTCNIIEAQSRNDYSRKLDVVAISPILAHGYPTMKGQDLTPENSATHHFFHHDTKWITKWTLRTHDVSLQLGHQIQVSFRYSRVGIIITSS